MYEPIELTLESPDGFIDCRLERNDTDTQTAYSATILYPHSVGGVIHSKVYVHDIILNPQTGMYYFADGTSMHPKVFLLENQISKALTGK